MGPANFAGIQRHPEETRARTSRRHYPPEALVTLAVVGDSRETTDACLACSPHAHAAEHRPALALECSFETKREPIPSCSSNSSRDYPTTRRAIFANPGEKRTCSADTQHLVGSRSLGSNLAENPGDPSAIYLRYHAVGLDRATA